MKKDIKFLFFLFCFLFASSSVGAYDYIDIGAAGCDSKITAWSRMYTYSGMDWEAVFDDCDGKIRAYRDSHSWGASCNMAFKLDINNPSVCMGIICCEQSVVDSVSNTEKTVGQSGTVTGVAAGGEPDAARLYAENYFVATPYPEMQGKIRTDGAAGFSYVATTPAEGGTVSVQVVAWKRGIYTNIGDNPMPLTGLDGGSGSGTYTGPSADEIGSSVESHSTYKGPSASEIAGAVNGTAGPLDSVNYDSSFVNPDELSISDRITSFVSGNPIISAINGSHLSLDGGVCSASVGSAFDKPLTLDFCWMGEYLGLFGNLMVTFAGLTAAFIIFRRD